MNRNLLLAAVLLAAPAAASAAVLPAAVPAGLAGIGVAAAVRGAVNASAPGQAAGRVLESGKPVYANDHVTTGPDGRLQILLLDETTFTIGPNSDMVLDEFVYDPATNTGKVAATISKGVFRFVTGKVAKHKPSDMKVALPVGTIGIRGTMVAGRVEGKDADVMLVGPGPRNNAQERPGGITVSNGGGSTNIDATGYGTSIRGGGAPSAGYRFSSGQISGILGRLAAAGNGSTGGNRTASNSSSGGSNGSSGSNSSNSSGGSGSGSSNGSTGGSSGGSSDAGVSGSASQNSGQNTASGGVNFQTTATNLVAQNSDTSQFAAQQTAAAAAAGIQDGLGTWDQIIANQTGMGEYDGSSSFTCSGGPCAGGTAGTLNLQLVVDFGSRIVGGNGSNIQVQVSPAEIFDSASISGVSYAGLTGAAVLNLTSASNNSNFTSISAQFNNSGGKTAQQVVVSASYSNPNGGGGSGSVTAPLGPVQSR